MVLLVDTGSLRPAERDDALSAVFTAASGPTRVTHTVPDELIRNKTQSWNVGPRNTIIRTKDTGLRLSRSPKELRTSGRELFAITYQTKGTSIYLTGDDIAVQPAGSVLLQDISRSYEFAFDGPGDNYSFLMAYDDLDMPPAEANKAALGIRSSPLYDLARHDLASLGTAAVALPPDSPAAAHLANATIQLTRALLASTTPTHPASRDTLHETLTAATTAYLHQHWNDPWLSTARIAHTMGLSARDVGRAALENGETVDERLRRRALNG
jgi:hypothetical protein